NDANYPRRHNDSTCDYTDCYDKWSDDPDHTSHDQGNSDDPDHAHSDPGFLHTPRNDDSCHDSDSHNAYPFNCSCDHNPTANNTPNDHHHCSDSTTDHASSDNNNACNDSNNREHYAHANNG
ncbi:unnamed protein product, partial [marine sediment metagenome]